MLLHKRKTGIPPDAGGTHKLHDWCTEQRVEYEKFKKGQPLKLNDNAKVQKLEEVNFECLSFEARWMHKYQALKAFHLLYGHCIDPKGDKNMFGLCD
jgi:hypothetical protein